MTGCPTPSPRPLRDTEAAEQDLVKWLEEWQLKNELEDYDVVDILRRRLHYPYLKKIGSET
jgi:predicted  nucleic acid-binding Zn ribbon protein